MKQRHWKWRLTLVKNSSVFTAVWSNGGITLLDDIAIIHRYSCGMGGSRV